MIHLYLIASALFLLTVFIFYFTKRIITLYQKLIILIVLLLLFLNYLAFNEWKTRPKFIKIIQRQEILDPHNPYKDTIYYFPCVKETTEIIMFTPLVVIEKRR
ncbi:MAG: hypothetical protein QXI58_00540 [Candidatus Micrarchaeia archaeon]